MANSAEPSGTTCTWTVLGRFGPSICAWTHGLPVSACCLEYPSFHTRRMLSFRQRWLFSNHFLLLHVLSRGRRLLHPTSRSVSSAQTAEIPTQKLSRNSEREILCVRIVGWSLATVLLILEASGGYVFPYSSYVLDSRSSVFPQDLRKR
jgi:hypothetical protein